MTAPVDPPPTRPQVIGVVVPARDEQATIGGCLRSIARAARQVPEEVVTVVVADNCLDATTVEAAAAGATVLVNAGSPADGVGAARRLGCAHALTALAATPHESIWLAQTDADSEVPPDWLRAQLAFAAAGFAAVAGLVTLAAGDDAAAHRRWALEYEQRSGHVHGANLGVRADAYLAVGGFEPVPAHEDLGLVQRLVEAGYAVARPDHCRVVTSGRLAGRSAAGMAADLRLG